MELPAVGRLSSTTEGSGFSRIYKRWLILWLRRHAPVSRGTFFISNVERMEFPDDFKVDAGILGLEAKIGVRENFFRDLLGEDDWSFVIKLHALFEAACTHLLLFHFKEPELTEIFARLELSNKTTGKIAFLGKLELLGKENRRLVVALSEMRNSLVHDVRNAEFSLEKMVVDLDSAALKQFATAFSPYETHIRQFPLSADPKGKIGYDEARQRTASLDQMMKRAKKSPKYHIWLGAYNVLVSIVDMYGYSDYKQWVKAKAVFEGDDDAV